MGHNAVHKKQGFLFTHLFFATRKRGLLQFFCCFWTFLELPFLLSSCSCAHIDMFLFSWVHACAVYKYVAIMRWSDIPPPSFFLPPLLAPHLLSRALLITVVGVFPFPLLLQIFIYLLCFAGLCAVCTYVSACYSVGRGNQVHTYTHGKSDMGWEMLYHIPASRRYQLDYLRRPMRHSPSS